jgi:hypothetical protein
MEPLNRRLGVGVGSSSKDLQFELRSQDQGSEQRHGKGEGKGTIVPDGRTDKEKVQGWTFFVYLSRVCHGGRGCWRSHS